MTGIKTQIYIARIGVIHQALGFFKGLHNGCHVMMITQLKTAICRNFAQLIQAGAQLAPFFIRSNRLVVTKHRAFFCKQIACQLTHIDARCADLFQKVQLCNKCLFVFLIRSRAQETRKPLRRNFDAAQIQCLIQHIRICREFSTDFCSLKACQCSFRDHLFKCQFSAQLRHIIVGPANRCNTKFYVIKHM